MNEFREIINEKLTPKRFEIEKKNISLTQSIKKMEF